MLNIGISLGAHLLVLAKLYLMIKIWHANPKWTNPLDRAPTINGYRTDPLLVHQLGPGSMLFKIDISRGLSLVEGQPWRYRSFGLTSPSGAPWIFRHGVPIEAIKQQGT